jgi:serine phosphatase RsbU (regulator of sigma subunit)
MLVGAVLIGLTSLGIFLYLVYTRKFASMRRGFYISLILAVAGGAFISAGLFGVWAYMTSEQMLFQQVVSGLTNVGDIMEANLNGVMSSALDELNDVARQLPAHLSEGTQEQLGQRLEIIARNNKRFNALEAIDLHRNIFVSEASAEPTPDIFVSAGATKPADSIEFTYALGGKDFISDAYFSPVLKRYVLNLATPIRDRKNAITGALMCQYDLQGDSGSLFRSIHFERTGYSVVVNHEGRIVAHPDARRVNEDISSWPAVQRGVRGETGWVIAPNITGEQRLFVYLPLKFPGTINSKPWVLLMEVSESEALAPILAARSQFLMGMGLLTILAVLSGYIVSFSMLRPVNSLNEFVKRVEAGELSARLLIREKDEIGRLGMALNEMTRGLEERDKIKETLIASRQVLQVARGIQMALLPRQFPAFPDLPQVDIFGMVRPALEVGGDLFNFFRLDENRVCFIVGDVSDKGVPAALFMAMVLTSFEISATSLATTQSLRPVSDSIAGVLEQVNRFLYANNDSQMFVTLFAGILNIRTGEIEYSDGGHEPPFIIRQGGEVEMLQKKGGIALGFIDPYDFTVGTIKLEPGDALVLYTDGVNEAMNGERKMFTTSAIGNTLRTISDGKPAEEICETIINKVEEFVQGAPQSDDITLVVIRYCGPEASKASADPLQLSVPV